jgi:hypothetical protein
VVVAGKQLLLDLDGLVPKAVVAFLRKAEAAS